MMSFDKREGYYDGVITGRKEAYEEALRIIKHSFYTREDVQYRLEYAFNLYSQADKDANHG